MIHVQYQRIVDQKRSKGKRIDPWLAIGHRKRIVKILFGSLPIALPRQQHAANIEEFNPVHWDSILRTVENGESAVQCLTRLSQALFVNVERSEVVEDCGSVRILTPARLIPCPKSGEIFGLSLRSPAFRFQERPRNPVNESAILWPLDLNRLHSLESFPGPSRLALLKPGCRKNLERTQEQHIVRGVGFFQNSDSLL